MKSTNKDNIIETIEEYVSSSPIRPVIIWFHSNPDIDNARRAIHYSWNIQREHQVLLVPLLYGTVKRRIS